MKTITRTDYSILSSPEIKNRLAKQAPIQEETGNIPNAAVLIPLFLQNNRWNVLFIHRSSWVDKHKDQVSFPGGMAEEGDQDPFETALRETREEIGIASELIKVLGQLNPLVFREEYKIYPIVGEIPFPIETTLSKMEVKHIFSIPLDWLADPLHYSLKEVDSPGGKKRKVYYFQEYEHELLWGISAFITIQLVEKLK